MNLRRDYQIFREFKKNAELGSLTPPPPPSPRSNNPTMAPTPSPLSQSQSIHSGSESSDDESPAVKQTSSRLAALALVEEVEINVEGLNPLSPEVICKQATINIGKSSTVVVRGMARELGEACFL